MSRIPELRTARLLLRPLASTDVDAVFKYASNPQVTRFMTWPTHKSVEDARSFLNRVTAAPPSQFDWGICLTPGSTVVGAIDFSFREPGEGEIHYTLDEPLWGQGLMTEGCQAVLDWAFSTFGDIQRISSTAVTANRGSTRVMEKLGMTPVGIYEEFWPKDQTIHQMSLYQITRDEWMVGGLK